MQMSRGETDEESPSAANLAAKIVLYMPEHLSATEALD